MLLVDKSPVDFGYTSVRLFQLLPKAKPQKIIKINP